MSSNPKQTVGELNGLNAALFKVNMLLIPVMFTLLVTWGTWVTANVFELKAFANEGDRWTKDMDRAAMAENWQRHTMDVLELEKHIEALIERRHSQ